eukprot:403370590
MYLPYIQGFAIIQPSNQAGQFPQQQFNGSGGFQQPPIYQNQQPIQYGQPIQQQQPAQFMNQQQPPMYQQQQPMMMNGVQQPMINQQQLMPVQQQQMYAQPNQQPQLIVSGTNNQFYQPPQQNMTGQPDVLQQQPNTQNLYSNQADLDKQV